MVNVHFMRALARGKGEKGGNITRILKLNAQGREGREDGSGTLKAVKREDAFSR